MRQRTSMIVALLASAALPACATKGYVERNVKAVNDKVETLSTSVEATQERTKRNEAEIGNVGQRTAAAQGAADRAQQSANGAGSDAAAAAGKANAADQRAERVGSRVEEVDRNARRLIYTVIL